MIKIYLKVSIWYLTLPSPLRWYLTLRNFFPHSFQTISCVLSEKWSIQVIHLSIQIFFLNQSSKFHEKILRNKKVIKNILTADDRRILRFSDACRMPTVAVYFDFPKTRKRGRKGHKENRCSCLPCRFTRRNKTYSVMNNFILHPKKFATVHETCKKEIIIFNMILFII